MPTLRRLSLLALAVLATGAAAQEGKERAREWHGEVGIGAEYDTNVSVDEVDVTSGEADSAWLVDFELGLNQPLGKHSDLNLNYDFSQAGYERFSRVDRQTHILGADIGTDLGKANTGVSAYYINSRLDGEPFLEYLRVSPSLSGFLARKWFARGAYVYSERTIDDRADRDATTHSGEVDLYYFHRGLRSYFNFGYRYRDEDATAARFDFRSHGLKLRYIRRFDLFERQAKVELAWRFEARRYLSPTPSIGEDREDDRSRWKLDLEVPLTPRLALQTYASYGDYDSNLPRADFTQTIVGARLRYGW
ncbi:MAG: surface lipoprotein assembly modifier [Pseudohaliea sp.]